MAITSGRLLARNTFWSLLGQGAPIIVAIFAIPILIRGLGTDRFGILTLAWVIIGYFSLFDFGLGRALTQLVARNLGTAQEDQNPRLVWTALFLMFVLGVIGAIVLSLASPLLVGEVLKIPRELQVETLKAFLILAGSIPVVISTTALRGVLEAHQRFALSNAVRIPSGIFTYAGPVAILPFSKSLVWVVAVLFVGRVVAAVAYFVLTLHTVRSFQDVALDRSVILPLLRVGGWMTVSNFAAPVLLYLDRFLIGAQLSVAAVAYYATPYEMVTRLLIIPSAIASVLFPAFSTSFARDRARAGFLLLRGVKYLFLVLFPITLVIVALAQQALTLWLGGAFADHSTRVLQWLAVGVLFNGLAQIPFALVQGAGRPDLTARLHIVELPIYVLLLVWLVMTRGIDGAAIGWAARTALDMTVLFLMAFSLTQISLTSKVRMAYLFGLSLVALVVASLPSMVSFKLGVLCLLLFGFALVAWFAILSPEERVLVARRSHAADTAN